VICDGSTRFHFPQRIWDSGRFLQRFSVFLIRKEFGLQFSSNVPTCICIVIGLFDADTPISTFEWIDIIDGHVWN
jgi:hypothetical protein